MGSHSSSMAKSRTDVHPAINALHSFVRYESFKLSDLRIRVSRVGGGSVGKPRAALGVKDKISRRGGRGKVPSSHIGSTDPISNRVRRSAQVPINEGDG